MSVDGDDETTSAVLTTMSDNGDDKNDGIGRSTMSFYKRTCSVDKFIELSSITSVVYIVFL